MMPLALDLFCGAGGASMGLYQAGFDVIGIDINPQPRYPFRFIQANALQPPLDLSRFDLIWASPPCQAYTVARVIHGRDDHPDLVADVRQMLDDYGAPYVIENVPGAPVRPDLVLCGSQFGQPRLKRHRWFETSFPSFALVPPCSHAKDLVSVFGHGGHIYRGVAEWRIVMGIDWMTRDELSQAIPPAYSEFIGRLAIKVSTVDVLPSVTETS